MNLSTPDASRRAYPDSNGYGGNHDNEMVDIDLEGGKGEKFGSPRMSLEDEEKQREEERISALGLEHRRSRSPGLIHTRTPSPLSRHTSLDEDQKNVNRQDDYDYSDKTPKASLNIGGTGSSVPASIIAATNALRKPPPIAHSSTSGSRPNSPGLGGGFGMTRTRTDEERENTTGRLRGERESSILSVDSQEGLLNGKPESSFSRSSTPPIGMTMLDSPLSATTTRGGSGMGGMGGSARSSLSMDGNPNGKGRAGWREEKSLEDGMEDISL
jgi:hypothetical protein